MIAFRQILPSEPTERSDSKLFDPQPIHCSQANAIDYHSISRAIQEGTLHPILLNTLIVSHQKRKKGKKPPTTNNEKMVQTLFAQL